MDIPIRVTVDRRTWYRGRGNRESKLLRKDGRMCCVGFLCKVMGWKDDLIRDAAGISELDWSDGPEFPKQWLKRATPSAVNGIRGLAKETTPFSDLYFINDGPKLPAEEREAQLIAKGRELGIEFSFEN